MLSHFSTRTLLFVCYIFLALWVPLASANSLSINQLVNQFVLNNPAIHAAQSRVNAAEARLVGAGLPLNNPELALDAERTDINTYTIGVSQTLDWHDKQSSLENAARINLSLAQAELDNTKSSEVSKLLKTIGDLAAYNEVESLSKHRVKTLTRFTDLAIKRSQVGDIPQTEMQLARLSLTEAVMKRAVDGANYIQAKMDYFNLTGKKLKEKMPFPQQLLLSLNADLDMASQARKHPLVQISYQKSLLARAHVKVVDQGRKVDPTIGVTAGKEDTQNLIGLSFSIPLQLRNNYQSNVVEANAEALKTEQDAQQVYRNVLGTMQGNLEQYELVAKAWDVWKSEGRNSLLERNNLLERQWQAGEMSTTDYLIQLQQTIDTQIMGVELHNNFWRSGVNWLRSTNMLNDWLNDTNKEAK